MFTASNAISRHPIEITMLKRKKVFDIQSLYLISTLSSNILHDKCLSFILHGIAKCVLGFRLRQKLKIYLTYSTDLCNSFYTKLALPDGLMNLSADNTELEEEIIFGNSYEFAINSEIFKQRGPDGKLKKTGFGQCILI